MRISRLAVHSTHIIQIELMVTTRSPSTVVEVDTALPAFVGYTERAEIDGRPGLLSPTLIHSLTEFRRHFGGPPMTAFDVVDGAADDFDVRSGDHFWKLKPSGPIGLLYHSLCLFYDNGGGACYVVSVGLYENEVRGSDLITGLESLGGQVGPAMLVVRDLSCLPIAIASDGQRTVARDRPVAAATCCGASRRAAWCPTRTRASTSPP
jgi:phage tail sheath protein FI